MPAEASSLDHRLRTLEAQIRALREHVSDAERSPAEVAHLIGLVDGAWSRIRAGVLRGWVEELVEGAEGRGQVLGELGPDGYAPPGPREEQLLQAVERIAR